jgi:hypothetical protein
MHKDSTFVSLIWVMGVFLLAWILKRRLDV